MNEPTTHRSLWSRLTRKAAVAIGCSFLVFALCLCGMVAIVFAPTEPQPEPRIQQSPTAAPLLELTAAPAPTTALELTNTPESTRESLREIQMYSMRAAEIWQQVGSALGNLSDLLQEPKLTNQDWAVEVAVQLATIRVAYLQLSEVVAPAELDEIHVLSLDALSDCNAMTYHLANGIDNLDATELDAAVGLLGSCNAKTLEAIEMMNEYSETSD